MSGFIFDKMLQWIYLAVYSAVAEFFKLMGNMGADMFGLEWVKATVKLFGLFGWSLFAAGTVVAVFDTAIEYQCGKANVKTAALNILKGFFACSLIGVLPVELYKFCITLQNIFSRDLAALAAGTKSTGLSELSLSALTNFFLTDIEANISLFNTLSLVAFAYCIIKVFFANIKRGGILLIQMSVGALYMFSVPRGYADGFNQWCKQVIAICLTAFLQTTLLYLKYADGARNYACGGRSAEDSADLWTGQLRKGKYDECGSRHDYGGKSYPQRGKGCLKAGILWNITKRQTNFQRNTVWTHLR